MKVPRQLKEDIDKIRRRFLWAGDNELTGGRECKVAWTTVAKPIDFGGLGIIDLGRFSRAIRWLWFLYMDKPRTSVEQYRNASGRGGHGAIPRSNCGHCP